jgi:WD40 repeat protein/outer membrane lipoprotein-sorting protein
MSDDHCPTDFESLEPPLETAVRATTAGTIPADAVQRVKMRARQLAAAADLPSPAAGGRHYRWSRWRSILAGLAATAALFAVVIGGIALLNPSGSRAFAQMLEKVKAVRTVRFTTTTQFGRGPETNGRMFIEGNRLRLEQFEGKLIMVADLDRKQALYLDMPRKTAQSDTLGAAPLQGFVDPIDQLRRASANDAEQIGEEILRGRRTRVYRLGKIDLLGIKGPAEALVWIDVERGLPAKIVIRDPDPKAPTEFRFDKFAWNERLDAGLFLLSVPQGFHAGVVVLTPHPTRPSEPLGTSPEPSNYLADGILSRDRVPAKIVWGPQGKTITALMRDPESVPAQQRRENELRQWDVATGKLRWSESIQGAGWLAGTADGKRLANVLGYEVQIRDATSGKITRKWATDQPLSPLAFSPDGTILAAGITQWGPFGGNGGKESGGVQFWDTERANLVRSIADDKPVTFVRYSVDGKYLVTSSNSGPLKLWNVATGELTRIFPALGRADFSPDSKTIACQTASTSPNEKTGRVELFNLRDGSPAKSLVTEKGESASYLLCVRFSPDGRHLAASDWNGTVTLWDVATGQRELNISNPKGGVHEAVFAPNGAMLATGSEDKILRLQKLPTEIIRPTVDKK